MIKVSCSKVSFRFRLTDDTNLRFGMLSTTVKLAPIIVEVVEVAEELVLLLSKRYFNFWC